MLDTVLFVTFSILMTEKPIDPVHRTRYYLPDKGHYINVFDANKTASRIKVGAKESTWVAEISEKCKRDFTMLPMSSIITDNYTGPDSLITHASPSTM